jgi:DNA polymerase I-like protein with 3'-5' exonuclease and polymerase domains
MSEPPKILTIDFETFYSQEFSLSKMTTEEYVRSPEFEVIGVSVQVDDGEPVWFSGTMADTEDWLKQFDWSKSIAVAHNAMFDGAILTWCFDIRPKAWVDTLSMARALHGTEVGGSLAKLAEYYKLGVKGEEVIAAKGLHRLDFPPEQLARYGEYCCNDVALTYKLFRAMGEEFPAIEFKLIDLTIKMYSDPVLRLSSDFLRHHIAKLAQRRKELLENFDEDTLMSNPQFADVLRSFGIEPPMKVSPTTGKQTYAFAKTDEGFKELLEHPNLDVQNLVAARLGAKSTLEHTRTQRFLEIAERTRDSTLPVPLRYYAAHTGRWGGDDKVNLQNLPRTSPLKSAIKAPPGYVIIDSDSSQIEARTLAWLAGQDDLVDAFEKKQDVYKIMAAAIYHKPIEKISKEERFVGKTTILGAGYGMGPKKFQAQLKNFGVQVELEEAERIIRTYREQYPRIVNLWKVAHEFVLRAILNDQWVAFGRNEVLSVDGALGIHLPNGLRIKYPNLREELANVDPRDGPHAFQIVYDTKRGKQTLTTKIYGGKVVENVCQALARIIIGEQMLKIAKKYRVVMTVHDAIACIAPKEEAETAKEYVELCMRLRPNWALALPLDCEAGYGESYGDC